MNVFCGTCGLHYTHNIHQHGTYSKLFNRSAPEGAHPFDRVRKEIHELIKRGNITVEESESIACNSWEREAMVPALTDEAFVRQTEYCLKNCTVTEKPHTTYDQAIVGLWAPELVKRFMRALSDGLEAGSLAHVLDQIRSALGQDETHYLVMADDIRSLVQAVENDNADAMTVLEQIRREPGSGTSKCKACSLEAEFSTEEDPHPIPKRFHKCQRLFPYNDDEHSIASKPSNKCSKCGNVLATLCRNGVLLCYDCMAKDLEARPLTELCSLHGPFDSSGGYCPECVGTSKTLDANLERTPDGHINNCSIANGEPETGCQICRGNCPDRKKFK